MDLKKEAEKFGIEITSEMYEKLEKYAQMLISYNEVMNLTAITDFDEVMKKHFLDSLAFVRYLKDKEDAEPFYENYVFRMIDVGTGAGFPGIPLAILFPNASFVLMDSLNKRIKFLDEVIMQLGLEKIDTIHGRAEDFAKKKEFRECFDFCVSRAVANLATLSEYCIPFVKTEGCFISYKSEKITEEYECAKEAIKILGGNYLNQVEFYLPNSDIYRNLFVIQKINNTPGKFPRKAGLPAKEPITRK